MIPWRPNTGAAPVWLGPLIIAAVLGTFGLVGIVVYRPVEMTVREYLDAEAEREVGGFRLAGDVVRLGGGVLDIQDPTGKPLRQFRIRDASGEASVHYDSDVLSVVEGQEVRVSGIFQKTLVFGRPGQMQSMTVGIGKEIEVLGQAPSTESDTRSEALEEEADDESEWEDEEPGRWDEEAETESWEEWDGGWQWDDR